MTDIETIQHLIKSNGGTSMGICSDLGYVVNFKMPMYSDTYTAAGSDLISVLADIEHELYMYKFHSENTIDDIKYNLDNQLLYMCTIVAAEHQLWEVGYNCEDYVNIVRVDCIENLHQELYDVMNKGTKCERINAADNYITSLHNNSNTTMLYNRDN